MSSLFEDLKEGLEEAIAYEKGYGAGRVKTYMNPTGPVFRLLDILSKNEEMEYIVAIIKSYVCCKSGSTSPSEKSP